MGEAARTMVYVHNCTPHKVLKNKTPEEVFFGKKPKVIHLRIFSGPVYINIPKEKRTKLDSSGKKGISVGYSESSKAYGIYFPRFKKIDISRDIKFDEDSAYNKSRKRPVEESKETEVPKIQDTTMNVLLPQLFSPNSVFHLNSGTPPYLDLLESKVQFWRL